MLRRYSIGLRVAVFGLVSVLALGYLGVKYLGLDRLVSPSYTVHAQFTDSGGIFSGAEVDLRGIQIGTVSGLHVDGQGVRVDLSIDHGVRVPSKLTATVTDRSALGEQFVQLEPQTDAGPYLHGGSVIPLADTAIPVPAQTLLASLDALAKSVPQKQLAETLTQLGAAFNGAGPDLQKLLDSTSSLTSAALADLNNTIELIQDGQTVLDTQVASSAAIASASAHLASLSAAVRSLDPTLAQLLVSGTAASTQVTDLLDDTQQALPALLDNLLTITDVAAGKVPQIRKLLVTFPHALEEGLTLVRYCDSYNADGTPVAGSCHYDSKTGLPIYSAHFGFQLSPYPLACTQGYGGTTQYLPDGTPLSGSGPDETESTPANTSAGCTASPTSSTPNVRGSQNSQGGSSGASTSVAYYDPVSGATVTDDGQYFAVPPATAAPPANLADLLTMGSS